jgi:hypothetical protein
VLFNFIPDPRLSGTTQDFDLRPSASFLTHKYPVACVTNHCDAAATILLLGFCFFSGLPLFIYIFTYYLFVSCKLLSETSQSLLCRRDFDGDRACTTDWLTHSVGVWRSLALLDTQEGALRLPSCSPFFSPRCDEHVIVYVFFILRFMCFLGGYVLQLVDGASE